MSYLFLLELPNTTMSVYHNEHGVYHMARIGMNEMAVPHRIGGPAIILRDGTEEWYENGVKHRVSGPAVTYPDGRVEYWMNGKKIR
jgi:hypothetical protein